MASYYCVIGLWSPTRPLVPQQHWNQFVQAQEVNMKGSIKSRMLSTKCSCQCLTLSMVAKDHVHIYRTCVWVLQSVSGMLQTCFVCCHYASYWFYCLTEHGHMWKMVLVNIVMHYSGTAGWSSNAGVGGGATEEWSLHISPGATLWSLPGAGRCGKTLLCPSLHQLQMSSRNPKPGSARGLQVTIDVWSCWPHSSSRCPFPTAICVYQPWPSCQGDQRQHLRSWS